MLNDLRSHGLWERTAPPPPPTEPLSGSVDADIVVIGGGFTGLSAALHLAEAGRRVVTLEANEIGFGGAGRNVGLINAGMWVMPDDLAGQLGDIYGDRLLGLLGNAPRAVMELIDKHGIDCELERNGTLHCAVGESGLKEIAERASQWARRGAPVKLLDATETAKRTGSTAYAGSLLDKRAGTLQPLSYVRGLAHAAIRAGAIVYTSARVVSRWRSGGAWTIATDRGEVRAPWVIVATDAYSTGPWKKVRLEQVHLPYFNLATSPLPPDLLASILPGREGAWDTKEILSSFRMDKTGRLIFGSVGALRNTGMAIHVAWAKRSLKRLFPQLGSVEFEAKWFGKIGMTDNALPRFHRFAANTVGFSGYNGRGIAPGTVFGQILARHVLGELEEDDLPIPITDSKEPRLRGAKEAYYEIGAQIAHFAGERF
ncbi:FAD-binding oxidoreductase [Mesorhizobium sp. VK22B]|uniref:FAD-binding oxidoreductase n=1 Tax=Mesorhizobium captivum TaxID=3072319 RepID=A0ABU4ZAN2_9HYPH|nr:FAD-binding oxidoreductase [Mesorhizobium sp. VK22B]MDX8496261.1 FAD-binding oxidoreductase [Mesorhizobium sp. VK22B]